MTSNGLYYYTSNGPGTGIGASTTDGAIYCQAYSTNWVSQIAQDYRNGGLFVRGKNNGTWQDWYGIPKMTIQSYPALLPTNGTNNWIKIGTENDSYGLLPSKSGEAGSGHNYLGTSSWYWKYAYIDQINTNWLRVVNNSSNNSDDAMVYIESKTANDWAVKINKGGVRYGVFIDSLDQDDALRTNGYIRGRAVWANQGSNGERQVGVDSSTSGTLYLYAHTTGKGLYSGSGYHKGSVITINSSEKRFYGNVTGNVTGNCSGSSGSCTGNAANVTGTVAVGHGGTGATSVSGAQTNLGIRRGTTSGGISVGAGSYKDYAISWSALSSTPTVVVGFSTTSTAGAFGKCCVAVKSDSITTTGCTIRIFNGDSTGRNPNISWVAIG